MRAATTQRVGDRRGDGGRKRGRRLGRGLVGLDPSGMDRGGIVMVGDGKRKHSKQLPESGPCEPFIGCQLLGRP